VLIIWESSLDAFLLIALLLLYLVFTEMWLTVQFTMKGKTRNSRHTAAFRRCGIALKQRGGGTHPLCGLVGVGVQQRWLSSASSSAAVVTGEKRWVCWWHREENGMQGGRWVGHGVRQGSRPGCHMAQVAVAQQSRRAAMGSGTLQNFEVGLTGGLARDA
jgi:hypothetical protein